MTCWFSLSTMAHVTIVRSWYRFRRVSRWCVIPSSEVGTGRREYLQTSGSDRHTNKACASSGVNCRKMSRSVSITGNGIKRPSSCIIHSFCLLLLQDGKHTFQPSRTKYTRYVLNMRVSDAFLQDLPLTNPHLPVKITVLSKGAML